MHSKKNEDFRQTLTPQQYKITREKGTEPAFSGEYDKHYEPGTYTCVCCGAELFDSTTKYASGSGWPSFYQPVSAEKIHEHQDSSHGMQRVEVTCSQCEAHLGHVFNDGPQPTGLRYCINSAALKFKV